ncbi:DoxX family protein [Candidatus Woesearchaeota archaeon]|nr:DoxX family protein [Candidatus Woesearchaeota archaeon]
MIFDRVSPAESVAYFFFRIIFGLLFAQHGLQKLFGLLGGEQAELFSLMGIAGVIELSVGVFVAVGLFTRPFAFLGAVTMIIAYGMAHFSRGWIPIQNGGELALLYLAAFLFISTRKHHDFDINKLVNLLKGRR